jgi:hypothetical protein
MGTKVYLIACLVLVVLLFSGISRAIFSNQGDDSWTTVKRGASIGPVELTKQGQILFHEGLCNLQIAEEDETTTDIEFSSLSPDGEYRIVIGDAYDFQPGYLLDVKKCALMHLPLPRYFQPWVSWAPNGQHALFYTNYEASPQLWILDLQTDQILEVHKDGLAVRADSCCGLNEWATKSGVGYLKPESVL